MSAIELALALAEARAAANSIESETLMGQVFSLGAYELLRKAFLRLDALLPGGEPRGPQPFEIRMQLLADLSEALRQRLSRAPDVHATFLGLGGAPGYELAVEMLEAVKVLMPPSRGVPIEEAASLVVLHGTVAAMGFYKGEEHRRNGNYSKYTMCQLDILPDLRSEDEEDQLVRLYVDKNDGKRFKIGQRIEIRLLPGQG